MTRQLAARAYRDEDGWWTIEIPELTSPAPAGGTIIATGAATTFRGIEKAAHELAAAWLDDDAVTVSVDVVIPEDVAQLWKDGTAAEEAAREQQARAATLRRDVVRALRAQGYPAEAVAAALGVSRQRIGQLEKTTVPGEKIAS
jgi:DNA-binding XRE family transcriptional regulator